jgi:NAD-dependent SIR2 family protein deacetylase
MTCRASRKQQCVAFAWRVRSVADYKTIIDWKEDLVLGDVDAQNRQLRPHIVWFGEEVPALEAVALTATADFFAVMVLTSLSCGWLNRFYSS